MKGKNFKLPGEADVYIRKLLDDGGAEDASAPSTALEDAQDLMYGAWEETDSRERISLAEVALEISADCADAFTLLGNEKAVSPAESRAYYEEGVRAGMRALGEKMFDENAGMFWGILETRPYMRARRELAICLWELGEREAAVAHFQELLRLNPDDALGCRYFLFILLTELGDDSVIARLIAAYPDDRSTEWLYDKALWLIRRHARDDEISTALDAAIGANPFVPKFLLGQKSLPRRRRKGFTDGSEEEAGGYARRSKARWVSPPGPLEDLRQAVARQKKSGKLSLQ